MRRTGGCVCVQQPNGGRNEEKNKRIVRCHRIISFFQRTQLVCPCMCLCVCLLGMYVCGERAWWVPKVVYCAAYTTQNSIYTTTPLPIGQKCNVKIIKWIGASYLCLTISKAKKKKTKPKKRENGERIYVRLSAFGWASVFWVFCERKFPFHCTYNIVHTIRVYVRADIIADFYHHRRFRLVAGGPTTATIRRHIQTHRTQCTVAVEEEKEKALAVCGALLFTTCSRPVLRAYAT